MRQVLPLVGIVLAADVLTRAQPQPGPVEPLVLIKKDNDNWINEILFTPDGRYLLTASHATGKTLWQRELPNGLGKVITAGIAIVKIWELPRGNLVRILEAHHGDLSGWAISDASGLLATGGKTEGTVKLWEIPSGRLVHTLDRGNHPVRFSPDGTRLWVSHRGSFGIGKKGVTFQPFDDWTAYDVASGKAIAASEPMVLSGDGRIGALDVKDRLEIRNALTGGVVRHLPVPWTPRRALSPDGSRFALAHGSEDRVTVELWNTQTGAQIWTDVSEHPPAQRALAARYPFHLLRVPNLVVSPDGATLIGWHGHAAAVRVWDVETGRQRSIGQSSDGDMQVRDVAFTKDGSLLAIRRSSELLSTTNPGAMPRRSSIGTVTFVRMSTLEPVAEITLEPDAADFAITRDASYVATRERDGNVRLWRTPPLAR